MMLSESEFPKYFFYPPCLKLTKWLDGWFCFNEMLSLGPGIEHQRQPQMQPRAIKVWVGFWGCKMGYPLSWRRWNWLSFLKGRLLQSRKLNADIIHFYIFMGASTSIDEENKINHHSQYWQINNSVAMEIKVLSNNNIFCITELSDKQNNIWW